MSKFKLFILLFSFFIYQVFAANSGQYFILTLPDFSKESQYFNWLNKTRPAGVMLASSNFKNHQQVKELCSMLQSQAKKIGIYPLIISIDWEGGIISRPSEGVGFISVPAPYNLAQAGRSCCFLAGKLIGQQLRDIGVNVDFAPSLDLFDKDNQVLATRCFSDDPDKTSECGIAFANGLLSEGVVPVVKHYPGLGLGRKDTHFSSVFIDTDEGDFVKHEKPFIDALNSKLPAMMVSHARFEQFGENTASRSAKVIKYLKKKNSDLIVITDDISMKAFNDEQDICSVALQSINHGFDFLIYFAPSRKQMDLIEKLNVLIDSKKINPAIQKIRKIISQRSVNLTKKFTEKQVGNYLAKRALESKIKSINLRDKECTLISVDLLKIRPSDSWFIDAGKTVTKKILEKENIQTREFILDARNNQSSIKLHKIISECDSDYIILQTFFYGDGIWNKVQKQWLDFLKHYQDKLIIFSLGHPFEGKILPKARIVYIGSFQLPFIKQAVKKIIHSDFVTGADKLSQNLDLISGKNIGLLCHKCSVLNGEFLPDFLIKKDIKLRAIFAPEHGLLGANQAGQKFDTENKSSWECPIYSLYGNIKSPTREMFENLDLLIIDFQEVGVRCYTYLSSLELTLKAAAKYNVPVLLLERPNPIKFLGVQGPNLNKKFESFIGKVNVNFIHGLTIGQIAENLNKKIGADLKVLSCQNDSKAIDSYFYSNFIPPSPNLVSIDSIYTYPCTVFFEGTNYSEGRGTFHPFEQIGAPWVDAEKLAKILNAKNLNGVYFEPISFMPKNISGMAEKPKYYNKLCNGVYLHIYDRKNIKPLIIAKTILKELFELYPRQSQWIKSGKRYFVDLLVGDDSLRNEINS